MRRILLATHGRMADGVLSAVRLIMGDTAKMDVINAYLDGTPPTREFKEYFDGVGESDTVIDHGRALLRHRAQERGDGTARPAHPHVYQGAAGGGDALLSRVRPVQAGHRRYRRDGRSPRRGENRHPGHHSQQARQAHAGGIRDRSECRRYVSAAPGKLWRESGCRWR